MLRCLAKRITSKRSGGLGSIVAVLTVAGLIEPSLRADIVTMTDGRRLEGTISLEKDNVVDLDTAVGEVRATLALKRAEIQSIERKPVAADFFDATKEDVGGGPAAPKVPEGLYLEVPIQGAFGQQVFARGVTLALQHAKDKGIRHVVFTVDSDGGPVDEAVALFKALERYDQYMAYHAVIRRCMGGAVIFPFQAETIHLMPGAVIGGRDGPAQGVPRKYASESETVARSQIALELAEKARKRGRSGDFIKALIDPLESLSAWRDADGQIAVGPRPPADLPPDRLIFQDGPDRVLSLTYEQATALGIPTVAGPEKLGEALGLSDWKAESSEGSDAMNKVISINRQRANAAQTRFEDDVAANIRMRETTVRNIEHNLKEAAKWNPTDVSYSSFSRYWPYYFDPGSAWDLHIWTPESRRKWKDRTDACGYYLTQAQAGIKSMIKLDTTAVQLSLLPTFKEGELNNMLDDINVKIELLKRHRGRVGD